MQLKYEGQEVYPLEICGLRRELPIVQVSPGLWIASFVMLGDVELVNACARAIAEKLAPLDFDFMVGPEAKVVPLLHSLATIMGQPRYVVCRKSLKAYMQDPLVAETQSITTSGKQRLVLDGIDVERLRGRKVAILDDVVSTGGSLKTVEELLEKADATIACRAAVLKEGDFYSGDLIYLKQLPVFTLEDR